MIGVSNDSKTHYWNQVGESSKQGIRAAWSTPIYQVKWWISWSRGANKTNKTSEMDLFLILVNGFRSLYNVTKSLVLVVVRVLDLPLHFLLLLSLLLLPFLLTSFSLLLLLLEFLKKNNLLFLWGDLTVKLFVLQFFHLP